MNIFLIMLTPSMDVLYMYNAHVTYVEKPFYYNFLFTNYMYRWMDVQQSVQVCVKSLLPTVLSSAVYSQDGQGSK